MSAADRALIVGAGPAGIAAAAALAARGVPYTLLEAGEAPLAGLRRIDPAIRLLTPLGASLLAGQRAPAGTPTYPSFGELIALYEEHAHARGLAVACGVLIEEVAAVSGGFVARGRGPGGSFEQAARWVIDASGMLATPHLPRWFDPARAGVAWRHTRDLRAEDLARARRLLVIGGGTSAVEAVRDWLAARAPGRGPDDRLWVSLRSTPRATPHRLLGVDVHHLVGPFERLPSWPGPIRALAGRLLPREPTIGTDLVRALRRGAAEQVAPVVALEGGRATSSAGAALEPDLVVFATGYEHRAAHLGELVARDARGTPLLRACESDRVRGLFLLGVRLGRTFASPFLRGIARDAPYVARRITREAGR